METYYWELQQLIEAAKNHLEWDGNKYKFALQTAIENAEKALDMTKRNNF